MKRSDRFHRAIAIAPASGVKTDIGQHQLTILPKMTKPIGYFCSGSMPGDTGLIAEMQDSWGSAFEALSNAQRLWMVQSIGSYLFNADPNSTLNSEHDDEIEEAIERLNELSRSDLLGILEALVAQVKTSK